MKKLCSLVLAMALLLSLAACGGEAPSPTDESTSPSRQETLPTTPTEPVTEDTLPETTVEVPEPKPTDPVQPTVPTEPAVPETTAPTLPTPGELPTEPVKPTMPIPTPKPEDPTTPTAPTGPSACVHSYVPGVSQAPGCTTAGYQSYRCGKCGASYQQVLPAAGHRWQDATCTQKKTCTVCREVQGETLDHSYQAGVCTQCGGADPNYKEDGPVTITIFIRGNDNKKLSGITVTLSAEGKTLGSGRTDAQGYARIELSEHPGSYRVTLSDIPAGYSAKDSYTFSADRANITLSVVAVIDPEDHSKAQYAVGKTMGDFTITDTDGKTYTLSALLEEKKLVVLNFWYVNCGPCKAEFPYFDSLYREYGDEIEILAMNHIDPESSIRSLKEQMELTFPMLREDLGMQGGFGIQAYPTTVIIGSGGRILQIKVGGYPSEEALRAAILGYL